MGWFSYELGREDGKREERNRNSGGCVICFWAMLAIGTPLGVAGFFRYAWKEFFHVEPPLIDDFMVAAIVLVFLAVIAVDEYRRKKGLVRESVARSNLRVMVAVVAGGATLVLILLAGIGSSGRGVNSHSSATNAKSAKTTISHRPNQH
jgi:hypothetical protein